MTFDELLHSILGFNNQGNVSFLLDTLKLDETSSYMRGLHKYVVISAFICETMSITPILYIGAKYNSVLLYHYVKDYDYSLNIMATVFFALRHLILDKFELSIRQKINILFFVRKQIPEKEMSEGLRKQQSQKWAHQW